MCIRDRYNKDRLYKAEHSEAMPINVSDEGDTVMNKLHDYDKLSLTGRMPGLNLLITELAHAYQMEGGGGLGYARNIKGLGELLSTLVTDGNQGDLYTQEGTIEYIHELTSIPFSNIYWQTFQTAMDDPNWDVHSPNLALDEFITQLSSWNYGQGNTEYWDRMNIPIYPTE